MDPSIPPQVVGLENDIPIQKITTGKKHVCLITQSGNIKCWGDNGKGRLGDEITGNQSSPVLVTDNNNPIIAIDIAGGNEHTCALLTPTTFTCWGDDSDGQLGDD